MNKKEEKAWQEQIISMRNTVQEMELKARYWKAEFELKDFYLKNRSIQEEYNKAYSEDLKKDEKAREELKKLLEEQQKTTQNLYKITSNNEESLSVER